MTHDNTHIAFWIDDNGNCRTCKNGTDNDIVALLAAMISDHAKIRSVVSNAINVVDAHEASILKASINMN